MGWHAFKQELKQTKEFCVNLLLDFFSMKHDIFICASVTLILFMVIHIAISGHFIIFS